MKSRTLALALSGLCVLSSLSSPVYAGGSADTEASADTEVRAVIDGYFKAFHAKNLKGMTDLSSPSATIVDYGQAFSLEEWNWYMQWSFKAMVPYDVKLTNFKTTVDGDLAYTLFSMDGGEPPTPEMGHAVLKRTNGKWHIEFIQIEKREKWLSWLHDRIDKGRDTSNWFEDYRKENP